MDLFEWLTRRPVRDATVFPASYIGLSCAVVMALNGYTTSPANSLYTEQRTYIFPSPGKAIIVGLKFVWAGLISGLRYYSRKLAEKTRVFMRGILKFYK